MYSVAEGQVAKSHDVELQLVVQDRRCGIHLGKLVDGAYCSSGCYGNPGGKLFREQGVAHLQASEDCGRCLPHEGGE